MMGWSWIAFGLRGIIDLGAGLWLCPVCGLGQESDKWRIFWLAALVLSVGLVAGGVLIGWLVWRFRRFGS